MYFKLPEDRASFGAHGKEYVPDQYGIIEIPDGQVNLSELHRHGLTECAAPPATSEHLDPLTHGIPVFSHVDELQPKPESAPAPESEPAPAPAPAQQAPVKQKGKGLDKKFNE